MRRRLAPSEVDVAPLGPGAVALDAHVDAADGGPPGHRWRPRQAHARPGQGPLDQVTGHLVNDHWHLVTYGLSEVDAKESDDPELSGWGFELTIRVEAEGGDEPQWAIDLLANLAVYVWTSRHPFAPGHHVALGGAIRPGTDTALTAAVVVTDPGLGELIGPFGAVEFLQIVGVTDDEIELCRSWSTEGMLGVVARDDPMLVTRLGRVSVLADPEVRAEAQGRAAADGASLTELRVGTLEWERRRGRATVVRLGAGAAAALGPALGRELVGEGATFAVLGDDAQMHFAIGPLGWTVTGGDLEITIALDSVAELATLFDGRTGWGRHPDLPGLRFQVIP